MDSELPLLKDLDHILEQKITCKGDSKNINLLDLYNVILDTKDKPLMEVYPTLYDGKIGTTINWELLILFHSVLHVHVRKPTTNVKIIRNNINFKIKNLLESYPLSIIAGGCYLPLQIPPLAVLWRSQRIQLSQTLW